MSRFVIEKLFEDRLKRYVYEFFISGDGPVFRLEKFTIETRQTPRHKFRADGRWTRRPLKYWERKIDLAELKERYIPDDVKEWIGVSMITTMTVEVEELT